MYILSVKKIVCVVFITKRLKLFLKEILWFAIPSYFAVPYFSFWYFLRHPDIKKQKLGSELACNPPPKMINYHIEGLYKTTCYKTKSNFSQFFFSHWLLHKYFFSFLIKGFANFKNLIRFHWQAFIVYKNGENLKMLIEIFCQKLIVSNVILAFLDHLKPKIFFFGQPWCPTQSTTLFQNLWMRPCKLPQQWFKVRERYMEVC